MTTCCHSFMEPRDSAWQGPQQGTDQAIGVGFSKTVCSAACDRRRCFCVLFMIDLVIHDRFSICVEHRQLINSLRTNLLVLSELISCMCRASVSSAT